MPHPFRFAELAPHPMIAPWVARVWEFTVHEGAPELHHVPPDGCTSMLVGLFPGAPPTVLVTGPWLVPLPVPVRPGARFVGLRFRCGAGGAALGLDPATLVNRTQPARPLLGPQVDVLMAEVMDSATLEAVSHAFVRFLEALSGRRTQPSDLVLRAVDSIETGAGSRTMVEVARHVRVAPQTLTRHFKAATGITPKQFSRIIRLRTSALDMMRRSGTLSRIAAERGYADQSHLTLDAVTLIGLTPAVLRDIIWQTEHDLAGD